MRLLQPRLKILYLIWKKRKVKNNLTELSRVLGYSRDSYVNTMVHDLLNDGFMKVKRKGEIDYLVLTRKGRRKIAPFTLTKSLPLLMLVVAFLPFWWGLDEVVFKTILAPFVLLLAALLLLFVALFLSYATGILEKEFF